MNWKKIIFDKLANMAELNSGKYTLLRRLSIQDDLYQIADEILKEIGAEYKKEKRLKEHPNEAYIKIRMLESVEQQIIKQE